MADDPVSLIDESKIPKGFKVNLAPSPSNNPVIPPKGFKINTPAKGTDTSSLESLAPPQDNKEGVYRMKDKSGKEYPVPYSKVEDVPDFRKAFVDEKEAQRYERDTPNFAQKFIEDTIQSHTQRLTDQEEKDIKGGEKKHLIEWVEPKSETPEENITRINFLRGVANGGVGLAEHPWEAIKSATKFTRDAAAYGVTKLSFLAGYDPSKATGIDKALVKEHDEFKNSVRDMILSLSGGKMNPEEYKATFDGVMTALVHLPKNADSYSVGQMVGQIIATKGAEKAIGGVSGLAKKVPASANYLAKEMAGISTASATDFVNKTMEENAKAKTDAAQKNAEAAQKHMKEAEEAWHSTKGAELEHEYAMRQAQEAAEEANRNAEAAHLKAKQKALHDTTGRELQTEMERRTAERKAAEDDHKSTQKHLEETHKALAEESAVAEANHKAAQEHMEATQKALESQKTVEDLTRKTLKAKDRIFPRFKVIQDAAKRYFNKRYNEIESATKGKTAPLHVLADAVYDAKLDKIEGSDTKQAIFDDILKKAKGELGAGEVAGRPENYDELAEDEKRVIDRGGAGDIEQGVSYKDLRGYDRELGKVIGSPSTAADVRQAALKVQGVIREMQQQIADRTSPYISKLNANISRQYRNYAETMLDATGGKASTVAKALREGDADAALKHFEGMTPFEKSRALRMLRGTGDDAQWLTGERPPVSESSPGIYEPKKSTSQFQRNMRAYREHTANMVQEYLEAKRQMAKLDSENAKIPNRPVEAVPRTKVPERPQEVQPNHVEPKPRVEIPEPPVHVEPKPIAQPYRTAQPDRPVEVKSETKQVGEEELTEANRKQYDDTVKKLRSRGIWYGTALSWLRVGRDLLNLKLGDAALNTVGAGVSTVGTIVGLNKLTEYLERPGVRDWVAKPSVEEIRQLNRLPAEQRKTVAQGLQNVRLATAKNGDKVSPLITAFIVANAPKSKPNAQQTPKENDALEGMQP